MTLLDIGGGYPSADQLELFKEEADAIKDGLHTHFSRKHFLNLKVIGEPGEQLVIMQCSTVLGDDVHSCQWNPQMRTPYGPT